MTEWKEPGPEWVQQKRVTRMATIDAMKPKLRELVNDYGMNIVTAMLQAGVTNPRHIRHLVETVLDDFSPTRGSYSAQGPRVRGDGR